jgi:hypothetical protein
MNNEKDNHDVLSFSTSRLDKFGGSKSESGSSSPEPVNQKKAEEVEVEPIEEPKENIKQDAEERENRMEVKKNFFFFFFFIGFFIKKKFFFSQKIFFFFLLATNKFFFFLQLKIGTFGPLWQTEIKIP